MDQYEIKKAATRERLREGLYDAMGNKPIFRIGVNDICRCSGVSRSAFYIHYNDIDALIREAEDSLYRQVVEGSSFFRTINLLDQSVDFQAQILRASYASAATTFKYRRELYLMLSDYGDLRFRSRYKKLVQENYAAILHFNGVSFRRFDQELLSALAEVTVNQTQQIVRRENADILAIARDLTEFITYVFSLAEKS